MESIFIKINSKNIDRKKIIYLRDSKQVQIRSVKLYGDNMGTLNDLRRTSHSMRRFLKIPLSYTIAFTFYLFYKTKPILRMNSENFTTEAAVLLIETRS